MEIFHALIVLSNFVIIPAITYGSQLALGALGVTLVYGILRFSNFAHGDTMALVPWSQFCLLGGFKVSAYLLLRYPLLFLHCR